MKISRCFNILRISIIFFICIGLLAPSFLYAQEEIDNQLDTLIQTGIDKVNKEEIDEALRAFQNIIDLDRESPIGYFYTAALYKALMQDYRTTVFNDKFDYYINEAIKKGEKLVKKDKENDLAYFYLGGAYGYRAIHKSEKGKWFGAFVDAEKGVNCLEKALSLNPELYDAYYGLGVYKYWRSVKSQVLWFLPFFDDERQKGINEIQLAIAQGNYSRIEAKGALVTILRNEGFYDKALHLTNEILGEYPENIYAMRTKGIILVELKRWNEATEIFTRLLEQIENRECKEPGAKMELEYYLALIHYEQEKTYENKKGYEKLTQLKEKLKEEAENEILNEMLNKVVFSKKDVKQSDKEI
jgi:tetratricopeptide (TPR) repeat protein